MLAYAEGKAEADHEFLRMLAIHASWCIAPHLARGERVTPARLLGEEIDIRDLSSEKFDERIRSMREKCNIDSDEE